MENKGLTFEEATIALDNGLKIKLPEWIGYWFKEDGKIKVFTQRGDILDTPYIETQRIRNDWEIAEGNLGFEFAILALKAGKLVSRKGWNGKDMFIFKRPEDWLPIEMVINKVKSLPDSVKDHFKPAYEEALKQDSKHPEPEEFKGPQVKFTAYLCIKAADGSIVNGWIPSQADLLADDWGIYSFEW